MNIPAKVWNLVMGVFGILIIFLVVVSIKEIRAISYVGQNPQMPNSITVQGTGEAVAIPDIATFSFTVTETAKTVADAQKAATDKTNAALKAVRDGGVEDKDISTISYSINPHYEYSSQVCTLNYCPPSKSVLTGYDVSQTIQVKVRDLSKAGSLFSAIGNTGVQNVNGLNFTMDDPDAVRAEARANAITEAKGKAEILAKQLGVSLVRITSFSENNNDFPRYAYATGKGGAADEMAPSVPQVPVGEQKVTETVVITYQIR